MRRLKLSVEKDSVVVEESQELLAIASRMRCFGLTLGNIMTLTHGEQDKNVSWRINWR